MAAFPSFDEIRATARALPPYGAAARAAVSAAVVASQGSGFETEADLAGWLGGAQRRERPAVDHPRLALFLAAHGIAGDLDGGSPEAVSADLAALTDGAGDLHRLVAARDADLRVYELALELPTTDSRIAPAMREGEAARAVAYGMMAVEPGLDVMVLAARGSGGDLAGSAVLLALSPDSVRPPSRHEDRIAAALANHGLGAERPIDPLDALAALGGPDIAAMCGAILAARLAGTAILLDGRGAEAAAAIVRGLREDAVDHCLAVGGFDAPPLGGLAALDLLAQACALLPEL